MSDDLGAAAPQDALAAAMTTHGRRLAVGANHPIELEGDAALYVRAGALDIFVQAVKASGVGRRRLVCTAVADSLILGGDLVRAPAGWRLLGVGRPGTELFRLDSATLEHLVGPGALTARFEAFVATARPDGPADFAEIVAATVLAAIDRDAAEAERLSSERERTHRLLDDALADLVDVVERADTPGRAPDSQEAQIELAVARICRELGVEPAETIVLEADVDQVVARVLAAGCRTRIVSLGGTWWSKPWMPLLAFTADDGHPVAVIPRRSGHVMFDPATGETSAIDRRVAGRIAKQAYAVYGPLPDGAGSILTLLRSTLRRDHRNLRLLIALASLAALVTLVTPMITAVVYNQVLPQDDRSLLKAACFLLGGATITYGLVALSRNLVLVRVGGLVQARIGPGLTDRWLRLPSDFFRRYDTGDLGTRADGLEVIHQELAGSVSTSLLTLLFSFCNVALIFAYSPTLGFAALATLVVVLAVLGAMNVRALRYQTRVSHYFGDVAADLFQMIRGIQKVRIAGAEMRLMARWASRFRLQATAIYDAGRVDAWVYALITAVPGIVAFMLYAVTVSALNSQISGGDFVAIVTALGQFTAAVTAMALSVGPLLATIPLWRRLVPILEEPLEETGTAAPGRLRGRIELRNVTFGYGEGGAPILHNVSLVIRPGEFVAITGSSGAGKSTLLRLLLGLEDPGSGTILYDGKDLRALDKPAVRRQFGVVMQGARPLPGEILSTILGDAPGDESVAWEAARAAALADDIRRMPMGMHTIIGEGGLAFSGGQVQRLMVARALARKPRFLFFDEATSALDDRAQEDVSRHIDQLESTRIVVAHRLSTIRHADRIVVLDGGQVVQVGPFEELMEADGLFRHLVSRQLM
ncbi:MAG: NHLP bacteriocin export ABC transporter permease/ATPase subunit [Acidimicrobiales bacterium]